jgi:hypothetical protein
MSSLFRVFFAASCICTLSACKSLQEQSVTSDRYTSVVSTLQVEVGRLDADQAISAARHKFVAACRRLSQLDSPIDNSACSNLELVRAFDLGGTNPTLGLERVAWATDAVDADRQLFATLIAEEVETTRRVLVASVITRHWRWAQLIGDKLRHLDAAVAASIGEAFVKRANGNFALAALGEDSRAVLSNRLDREQALLDKVGFPARDSLYEQTLADIFYWSTQIKGSALNGEKLAALKAEIIAYADNGLWELSDSNVVAAPIPDGLLELDAIANMPPTQSAFDHFLERAAPGSQLRGRIDAVANSTAPRSLSAESAECLTRDCKPDSAARETLGRQVRSSVRDLERPLRSPNAQLKLVPISKRHDEPHIRPTGGGRARNAVGAAIAQQAGRQPPAERGRGGRTEREGGDIAIPKGEPPGRDRVRR